MNKSEEIFKDYPAILQPKLEMNVPNEEVFIHEGFFTLKFNDFFIKLTSKIVFKWLPDLAVKIYGNFLST